MEIFKRIVAFLFPLIFFSSNILANEKLELGLEAYNENSIELGDYFISSYLAEGNMTDELYQRILALKAPTSFISGHYSDEFLDNFQFESWSQWQDTGNNSMEHKVRMLSYEAIEDKTKQYANLIRLKTKSRHTKASICNTNQDTQQIKIEQQSRYTKQTRYKPIKTPKIKIQQK